MYKFLKNKLLIGVIIVISLIFIYYFPFQYLLAQKNFEKYINLQGVQVADIASKTLIKNYKQDGYYIDVVYNSDPQFLYSYKFSTSDISKFFSYKSISCVIYNLNHVSVEVTGESKNVKYPPLDVNK